MSNLNEVLHIKNQLLKSKNKEINALQVKVKALTKALEVEVAGSSCCEEAQLTANELARRDAELGEAEVKIVAQRRLRDSEFEYWSGRAEKAEDERDELQAKLDAAEAERDRLEAKWNEAEKWADVYREERDDLKASLRELQPAESHVVIGGKTPKWMRDKAERLIRLELGSAVSDVRGTAEKILALTTAAENRPTLSWGAVEKVILNHFKLRSHDELNAVVYDILALAPAEGWPEWLGPKIDPDDFEVTRDSLGNIRVDGEYFCGPDATPETVRDGYAPTVRITAKREAVARFIERN